MGRPSGPVGRVPPGSADWMGDPVVVLLHRPPVKVVVVVADRGCTASPPLLLLPWPC